MLSRRKLRVYILVFLAPAVLIYTAFMIYPLLDSLWLSVNNKAPGVVQSFVGFQHYFTLLMREQWSKPFWNSFRNNILFFLIHMAVQNPVGLFLAALLNMRIRGSWIYRTAIFVPTILSVVIVGFVWKLVLNPAWGISRSLLQMIGLGAFDSPWLGLESTALVTLSLISVWQNIGIPMLLFLAALIRIPEELIEAARVDGAGGWKIFWRIQLPLILPSVGIVSVLTFVGNFNAFELIYATQVVPIRLGTVGILRIMVDLHLVNTLWSLILVYAAQGIPLAVFILTAFMRQLPKDLTDAARIDGANEYHIYLLILPLVRPAIGSVLAISMIPIWNDLWFPLILSPGEATKTLVLGAQAFLGEFVNDYNAVLAALTLAILPPVILYLIFARQLVRGIIAGAVK
jgi:raffinose/stachyose/melibiose transport system permease protein